MAKFTFIDLFAGIGGFRIALSNAGGTCLGFSEIAPDAINAYCTNFHVPESANFGDITKLKDLPEHDFLSAGVPCQSWSIAGKKLGFDDDRGQLWNDTLYLLNKARPKAFIFENVKGLTDPRNADAIKYIMNRISEAGYHAHKYVLNAYDYGVPQTRIRVYIIGFEDAKYQNRFKLPQMCPGKLSLQEIIDPEAFVSEVQLTPKKARWSLSCNEQGFNDYFLFNDLRNGATTIHTWDILDTTEREKYVCEILLKHRRRKEYGILDGNPLSAEQLYGIDSSITECELEALVEKSILKRVSYRYAIIDNSASLTDNEEFLLSFLKKDSIIVDELKTNKAFKIKKINVSDTIYDLVEKGVLLCSEIRYDFKHTKISTGLYGINRIFLRTSKIYPTMVASDTNDYIATVNIHGRSPEEYKREFMEKIYKPHNYRQITKEEACMIQGFPIDYILPETRARWMKLIGNSIPVSLVKMLAQSVVDTGVFCEEDYAKTSYKNCIASGEFVGTLFEPERNSGMI